MAEEDEKRAGGPRERDFKWTCLEIRNILAHFFQ
jgi:hypothetical protein